MKKILSILAMFIILASNICIAQPQNENMQIIADKQWIEKEEEVTIKLQINNVSIASCTIEIYWDTSKLEYVKGPENSNYSNNRIIYMGVSSTGKNVQNIEIGDFVFKALKEGVVNIVATGEFYDENGNALQIDDNNLEIGIGNKNSQINVNEIQSSSDSQNAELSVLRINYEGISPRFEKKIKEYYFIAGSSINNIEVTALPENLNATVTVRGNNDLQFGKNTITINVISEDKTKQETYKIYVTKTVNEQTANANLENLAIKQATLSPEFDSNITNYDVEISNDVNKIDLLAIPQNQNAIVQITGNDKEMQVGDNSIQINVLAQDKITNKRYEIVVHRRSPEEQVDYENEAKLQVERLSAIIEEQEKENQNEKNEGQKVETKKSEARVIIWWLLAIVAVLACSLGGYFLIKKANH